MAISHRLSKPSLLFCFILISSSIIPIKISAQEQSDTIDTKHHALTEVVVFSNKFAEKFKRIAQTVDVLKTSRELTFQHTTADALTSSGKLFVQKSQQGGGSPVIRGFEASRILLMVDGVRMNNAIYRAGHLQNIISVDNMSLERLEVIYGPSSTLYGSDALGGVVNMYTKGPVLSETGKKKMTNSAALQYATASNEFKANIQMNVGEKKWATFSSITYSSFGDLIQGKKRSADYPDFGQKKFLVQRIGNTDLVLPNPDPDKQSPSGYQQIDYLKKILYQPNQKIAHLLNYQISKSTDIPRYDRLTELSNNQTPVYAEWYYGPQLRAMVSYQLSATQLSGFFQDIRLNTNYQDVKESRISRKYQNNNKDFRWERVRIVGLNFDAKHYKGRNELHLGAEYYYNKVQSTAERVNIVTGSISKITTRYADGPSSMSSAALYAQHTNKINERWTLNDGLRINLIGLDAQFLDTSLMKFPFTRAKQNNTALTGNIGIIYASESDFKAAFVLSSGFRSPNIDDLSKVFDTRTGMVVVPNRDIQPEYTYNAELNLNQFGKKFNYGVSLFYTVFKNALVLDRFRFNGQDSVQYNGVTSAVYAMQNKAHASVYGASLNASLEFSKQLMMDAVATYTRGKYTDPFNALIPLDHIPPVYGRISLKYVNQHWVSEAYSIFNGWKRLSDYNPNGEDNQLYATRDGSPSWLTYNLRTAINIRKVISLQLTIENITDRNYRYFASGISAPGRNWVMSFKANF